MKKIILSFFCVLNTTFLICQPDQDYLRDKVWMLGRCTNNPFYPQIKGMKIDFDWNNRDVSIENHSFGFTENNASICDQSGNLLFFTNGVLLWDSNFVRVNTDTTFHFITSPNYINNGLLNQQGSLILPIPETSDYEIIYAVDGVTMINGVGVWATRFVRRSRLIDDLSGNFQIMGLNDTLNNDTLSVGKITACRHANGRDWWILLFEWGADRYYRYLLDPLGIHQEANEHLDMPIIEGLSEAVFSPDGSKYVQYNLDDILGGNYVDIFDFDRCDGTLYNQRRIHVVDTAVAGGGTSISNNSRFLYLSSYRFVYQFDLNAPDIEATKDTVAVYDGFVDTTNNLAVRFYLSQLAHDGKIYITATNSVKYLHVIENPDLPGDSCNVSQHGVELPALNYLGLPNYPYFRLGALDGTICDSLGIDAWQGPPVGVGQSPPPLPLSQETKLLVWPNPATTSCTIGMGRALPQEGRMEVHDMSGRLMEAHSLRPATIGYGLNTSAWPAGVYVATVWSGGEVWGIVQILIEN